MFDICLAESILYEYNLYDNIANIISLQETLFNGQVRCIYRIDLSNGKKLICRLSKEANFSKGLIEQQSQFSEKLRNHGILVPKKYCTNSGFCINKMFNNIICNITLEEYVGCDYESIELSSFNFLGKTLGKMHYISEKDPTEISYSHISQAIKNGRAKFSNLYHGIETEIKEISDIKEIESLHDGLIQQLKLSLNELPHGAVHGDLGVYNNLVIMNNDVYVIDFNLAGDEPYIFDMICCFYSSVYKLSKKENINISDAYKCFIDGYVESRKFSCMEKECFSIVAALFDGLFYSKSIIERYKNNRNKQILEEIRFAKDKFGVYNHIINWNNQ